jgi:hypothetical protein
MPQSGSQDIILASRPPSNPGRLIGELMHTARPILLDLADRPDLRETARDWQHRIDIHTAETDHRPADAL